MRHGTSQKPARPPDKRFSRGLVADVARVLEQHGYGRLSRPQHVELSVHLLHLLHGDPAAACKGHAR